MLGILARIAFGVGLVDSKCHGDGHDGGLRGVLLLEEGVEQHTVVGAVN